MIQMDRVYKEERNHILGMAKKIKATGCNVLLIQKSILRDAVTDLSLHYLVSNGSGSINEPSPLGTSCGKQTLVCLQQLLQRKTCKRQLVMLAVSHWFIPATSHGARVSPTPHRLKDLHCCN